MRTKILCSVFCFGISIYSFSQQKSPTAIATAGGISGSANIILEWTVGEAFIETISTFSNVYTQGFHQPILDVEQRDRSKGGLVRKNTVHVYPNPVTAILNVRLETIPDKPMFVSLVDVNGRVLLKQYFADKSSLLSIDVRPFTPGSYFLRIIAPSGGIEGEYKVIKAPNYSTNKTF